MKKRILCVILALTMFVLTGCGGKNVVDQSTQLPEFTDFLVIEKVGTITGIDNVIATGAGLTTRIDGKYAILSHEGLHNSGAVYEEVNVLRDTYYQVATKLPAEGSDSPSALNCRGVVDSRGRVILPQNYAKFYVLSDRYIITYTATERTYTDDENVLVTNTVNSVKYMYKGVWNVFDAVTGRFVPGVTGTTTNTPNLRYGDYLNYKVGDNYVTVDASGTPIPSGRTYFDDGSYMIEGKVGEMFDKYGNKLFAFDLTGFVPNSISGDFNYYTARKYDNGETKYVIMDRTGKVVSTEFSGLPFVNTDIVSVENKLYDFNGNSIVEGEYMVTVDKMLGRYYCIRGTGSNDEYKIIDREGNIYVDDKESKKAGYDLTALLAYEKKGDDRYYYSYKDKDFTIKGYSFAPWVVKTESANYRYDLVDAMTGKTLLEGYKGYDYTMKNDYSYYVYAEYEGATDVYVVVANSKIAEMRAKKESLLSDLTAAFEKAGINVNIDKETGEMAMDTTVLFGGDSAELTPAGKDFLNKFIKVYTEVAFSDKYAGFITKTLVEGHTAPVQGSSLEQSMPLSVERANNVLNYCLSAETGVNVSMIRNSMDAVGYGNSQPIYGDNGEVNMEASRRVAFKFLVSVSFL